MASRLGCAILDANVVKDAFGDSQHDAGRRFRQAIVDGKIRLVSGGKLHEELLQASHEFRQWASVAQSTPSLQVLARRMLTVALKKFEQHPDRESDDPHVLAVALVSGARLLYSNDRPLHADFKKSSLLPGERGVVFSTLKRKKGKGGRNTYEPDPCARYTSHRSRLVNTAVICGG